MRIYAVKRHACLALCLAHVGFAAMAPLEVEAQSQAHNQLLAREKFQQASEASERGDWKSARQLFLDSYAAYPRNATLINVAVCETELGLLLEARAHYLEFLKHADSDGAAHKAAAETGLKELEANLSQVVIDSTHWHDEAQLTLNETPIRREDTSTPIHVLPGEYKLRYTLKDGTVLQETSVSLKATERFEFVLNPLPPKRSCDEEGFLGENCSRQEVTDDGRKSIVESPWFWGTLGALAAGGVVTLVVLATQKTPEPTRGNFGNGVLVFDF